ncbi:SWIM zinc finger family protein [Amycolatopsis sp. 195334CR]|uniref:SWIM zinc finger family protein n=1 Tax=Amycolatopsis sp. 195334CR TaxID=2814588 RepID=UPI001A8EEA25|nr:SWIM zinc finger family protein [Amycolatopsis sp. 195334CR]MBN6040113.1 SWIM zinc finger family protein [Amycolatopsis sp. 195334CR]
MSFGTTVWGRDWVRLAEPTSVTRPDSRLPKARSLARREQVHDVELAPGTVTAAVDGYRVRISVPQWDPGTLDVARTHLRGDDLPDAVHADLPGMTGVASDCDCSQRKNPCVHALATFYEVARRLDERPRLAILLRGLTHTPAATATRIPLALLNPTTFYGD